MLNKPKTLCILLLLTSAFCKVYPQVGINTTTPRKTLEVAGDTKISDLITIKEIRSLRDGENSTFLIQDDQNDIKVMDVSNPTGQALGYIQEYIIVHPNGDWVLDFDTGINAQQYVLNIISANYDRELIMGANNSSIPYSSSFIRNQTWHIIADYPSASNLDQNEIGTWTITTLIYSKDLSKQFEPTVINMRGNESGSAQGPIIN